MKSQSPWRLVAAAALLSVVVACGGGGGGGDAGGSPGAGAAAGGTDTGSSGGTGGAGTPVAPRAEVFNGITLTQTTSADFRETGYIGGQLRPLVITTALTLSPDLVLPDGILYTRVTGVDPRMFDPASAEISLGNFKSANLTLKGLQQHALQVGTYTSNVQVDVCVDAECTRPVAGSPLAVRYTLDVKPAIDLLPVSVVELRGRANTVGATVEVPLNVPEDAKEHWGVAGPLDAAPAPISIGQLPTNTRFSITPGAAAPGTYQGRYRISWMGFEEILVVNYVVTP
ncbi:MAG TPA: hypothetical protein VHL79_10305 [Ramlibacter sp.]|jgi:hypothetical protein|nr:hypothetical protein [Ramlibacter sp.]